MRGDEHGHPALGAQREQQVDDFGAGRHIEVAGGLVGEQQPGRADQRAGDGDPLLLPARQLRGQVVLAAGQTDRGEQLGGAGPAVEARPVGQDRGEHVVKGGQRGQQVKPLEDEPDGPAVRGPLPVPQPGQLYVAGPDRPAVRQVHRPGEMQQR